MKEEKAIAHLSDLSKFILLDSPDKSDNALFYITSTISLPFNIKSLYIKYRNYGDNWKSQNITQELYDKLYTEFKYKISLPSELHRFISSERDKKLDKIK